MAEQRKFDNQAIELPTGEKMTLGTYQGPKGEMCVKLRLPEEWDLTAMFRRSRPKEKKVGGNTVVEFDRRK